MNKKSHNKKRNVGIIYEQLVLKLSKALVENDKKTFSDTKKIIKKYFSKNTELYKEHRLLNSVVVTNIEESAIIPAILEEVKKASWRINNRKLDNEKSRLIRTINETFGKSFYSTRVSNYRDLATVNILISEYRKGAASDPKILMEYYSKVSEILKKEKSDKNLEEIKTPEVNSLVVKLMTEKFNKSYSKNLAENQIKLLKEWSLSDDQQKVNVLNLIKTTQLQVLEQIENYRNNCENSIISEKIEKVYENIKMENFNENIDDTDIVKAMVMLEISNELRGEDNE
tara:strand:+ start:15837 stop:16691 length:855 start_codon:yes stop_codon:yes gene_type:complete